MRFSAVLLGGLMLCGMAGVPFVQHYAAPVTYLPLASADEPTPAGSTDFAPIDYYQNHCSRCHGFYGMNYNEDFDLKKLSDDKLKEYVDQMAQGPGQAPLDIRRIEIETAYHRSLIDGKPFIAITQIQTNDKGVVLTGEATPDSKVQIVSGSQTATATLTDHNWQATLPAGTKAEQIHVTAAKADQQTDLDLGKARYSHLY